METKAYCSILVPFRDQAKHSRTQSAVRVQIYANSTVPYVNESYVAPGGTAGQSLANIQVSVSSMLARSALQTDGPQPMDSRLLLETRGVSARRIIWDADRENCSHGERHGGPSVTQTI